jgi:hypothetical protein
MPRAGLERGAGSAARGGWQNAPTGVLEGMERCGWRATPRTTPESEKSRPVLETRDPQLHCHSDRNGKWEEVMAKKNKYPFSVNTFLSTVDGGRTIASYGENQKIFTQGEHADSVFYIREGKIKVCVISEQGKEAVVALHGKGDFFGEGCLTGQPLRLATARR